MINKNKIKKFFNVNNNFVLVRHNIISKIKYNAKKIRKYSTIPKKCIIIGSLIGTAIFLPLFQVSANAQTPITDPTGYYELSEDRSYLYIYGDVDFSIIENEKSLTEINVEGAKIDETFEINNPYLSMLTFDNCNFSNAKIENTSNIISICFTNCKLDDLSFISNFENLKVLSFNNCQIGSINGIENLSQLERLSFYTVGIENISELQNLNSLNYLDISNTYVKDLSPLINLNIEELDISNTLTIQSLEPIKQMKNLRCLYSENCQMLYDKDFIDYINAANIESNISYEDLEIKNAVKNIAKQILNNNMTDEEKINAIVNYVIDNIEFDEEVYIDTSISAEYNQNALSHALNGIGCCKNYTILTSALMKEAGINVYETRSETHIWNLVEVEGEYYWIDSTWLDGLTKKEVLESKFYMNNEYEFAEHDDALTIPSSLYNYHYNLSPIQNDIGNQNIQNNIELETIDYENKQSNYINIKKASLSALVGVAVALGVAIPSSKKIKNKEKNINITK